MYTMKILLVIPILALVLGATGCRRTPDSVWEDTKSAGRHVNRGFRTLGGKHGDSRQVKSRSEFMCDGNEGWVVADEYVTCEYVPMEDNPYNNNLSMSEVTRAPRESPGEPDSTIPGIDAFRNPGSNPRWAAFQNITFPYNSSLVKGDRNLAIIHDIADYMRQTHRTYIFVEGHCDERGPEAYNLALGSHRSNAVRNMLINEGVSPDNIFTISYGKERPLVIGHDDQSWEQNRRAEFKVYER